MISVSALGPSTTKADYSNYGWAAGEQHVEVSAPGGWFRDFVGTPTFRTPGNMVLSSYPLHVAIDEELANPDGTPTDAFSVQELRPPRTLRVLHLPAGHVDGVAARRRRRRAGDRGPR